MQINYQKMLSRLGALCAAGTTALAGSVSYNFDSDPTGILSFYGNAAYVPTDGNPATGGYLSLTDAINSQRSFIVFDDFDNGLVVKAFSFSMDVRIGGGNTTPADGFSIDYVRASDPVLVDPPSMNGWASNPGGEANSTCADAGAIARSMASETIGASGTMRAAMRACAVAAARPAPLNNAPAAGAPLASAASSAASMSSKMSIAANLAHGAGRLGGCCPGLLLHWSPAARPGAASRASGAVLASPVCCRLRRAACALQRP